MKAIIKDILVTNEIIDSIKITSIFPEIDGKIDIIQSEFVKILYKLPASLVIDVYPYQRIDNIAYKYYRDTRYWWIILLYNNVRNPLKLPNTLKLFDKISLFNQLSTNAKYKVILPNE